MGLRNQRRAPSDLTAAAASRTAGTGPVLDETFEGGTLDERVWSSAYLPHWTASGRSEARYALTEGMLVLRIDPDQPAWCPEFDGGVKCSMLQTGQFAGPLGSPIGQHRFRDGLRVRSEHPNRRRFVAPYQRIEMRARATMGPAHLVSLYLIGYEDQPEKSGEITLMEVFGRQCHARGCALGHGIKQINDPRLRTIFFDDVLPIAVEDWHVYAIDWQPSGIDFYLDGRHLHHIAQAPDYPMQLMLGLYELPGIAVPAPDEPPRFFVDYVKSTARLVDMVD